MRHTRKLASLSVALLALTTVTATARAQDSTAKAICKDGTTATTTGRGACSHHGGVDKTKTTSSGAVAPAPASTATKATPTAPAQPATPAAAATTTTKSSSSSAGSSAGKTSKSETTDPTGAIAKCKDGLYSHSAHHTGACSRHGGVAQWLDSTKTK